MTSFNYLEKLDISTTKTSEYVIHQIEGLPTLFLTPATEVNKPFFNALLKRARKTSKSVQAGAITSGMISNNRDEDRVLYAQHIIKDWKGVIDDAGNEVPFTPEIALKFLEKLPGYIFDGIRDYASNPLNFIEQDGLDVEQAAKN